MRNRIHSWFNRHISLERIDGRAIIIACVSKYRNRVVCAVILDGEVHSEYNDLTLREFGILVEEMTFVGSQ